MGIWISDARRTILTHSAPGVNNIHGANRHRLDWGSDAKSRWPPALLMLQSLCQRSIGRWRSPFSCPAESIALKSKAGRLAIPTHHRPAFRSLRRVVVHRHLGALDEDRQAGPVVAQALQDLPRRRCRSGAANSASPRAPKAVTATRNAPLAVAQSGRVIAHLETLFDRVGTIRRSVPPSPSPRLSLSGHTLRRRQSRARLRPAERQHDQPAFDLVDRLVRLVTVHHHDPGTLHRPQMLSRHVVRTPGRQDEDHDLAGMKDPEILSVADLLLRA